MRVRDFVLTQDKTMGIIVDRVGKGMKQCKVIDEYGKSYDYDIVNLCEYPSEKISSEIKERFYSVYEQYQELKKKRKEYDCMRVQLEKAQTEYNYEIFRLIGVVNQRISYEQFKKIMLDNMSSRVLRKVKSLRYNVEVKESGNCFSILFILKREIKSIGKSGLLIGDEDVNVKEYMKGNLSLFTDYNRLQIDYGNDSYIDTCTPPKTFYIHYMEWIFDNTCLCKHFAENLGKSFRLTKKKNE